MGVSMFFTWIFFSFFTFQIYHSPIHKQAESKSLVIAPSIPSWLFLNVSFFFHLFSFSAVDLNEVGFKFVQKCINCIETKGKRSDQDFLPSVWGCVTWPEGGIIESHLPLHAHATPANCCWWGGKVSRVVLSDANYHISATLWESCCQMIFFTKSIFLLTNP